jgi:acetyl esterase/lipase
MHLRSALIAGLSSMAAIGSAGAQPVLLRTVYALDDSRGYCIDVEGFGPQASVDAPLKVHTCKYGADLGDQIFERADDGRIEMPQYGRCLAADALEPDASVYIRDCARIPTQQWRFEWGRLSPQTRPDLCVTLADGPGTIEGTPVLVVPAYRSRSISLAACSEDALERQTLRLGPEDERPLSAANTLRDNIPADIAARLAEIGHVFGGEQARETIPLVAAVARTFEPGEIEVITDVAYGPDPRHRFDIRRATSRQAEVPVPVVIVFHGGGLVGGSKDATANPADYFASLGFIGVNSNYRLAPDHPWPAGPLDVGRAVTWLSENIAEYGGDPNRIFVLGISSGALHSAGYVFRSDLLPAGTARAAGAILMSGPYTFDFENVGLNQIAYYGDDRARYPERVVVGNVTSTDIPVMFTTAEWDPPRYTNAFAELLHELVIGHGVMPRYHQSLGHNHESQMGMLGTAETNVSAEIIDFIEQVSASR